MSRNFDFSNPTKRTAFQRQWNLCAVCGKSLVNSMDHAHHVIPDQVGSAMHNRAGIFLESADNCVILCDPCHYRVHENGRYRTGAVAPASYFEYSHGNEKAKHNFWTQIIENEWTKIFK